MEKYGSRKFLVSVGAILTALAGTLSGQLDFAHAIAAIATTAVAYTGVQSIEDFKKGTEGNKYLSRKFLVTAAAILSAVGGMLAGDLSMIQGITAIVSAGIGYAGLQGFVDSFGTSSAK